MYMYMYRNTDSFVARKAFAIWTLDSFCCSSECRDGKRNGNINDCELENHYHGDGSKYLCFESPLKLEPLPDGGLARHELVALYMVLFLYLL